MKTTIQPLFLAVVLALTPLLLNAEPIPTQPMSPALPAKSGSHVVNEKLLLNFAPPNLEPVIPRVNWLDESHLILSLPPSRDQKQGTIEQYDLATNKRLFLTAGDAPQISPNGKWIAYLHNQNNSPELWIMNSDGTHPRKLTLIENGAAFYNENYSFTWSPDSKKIAFAHYPFQSPWEKKKPAPTFLDIINIITKQSTSVASFEEPIRGITWLPNSKKILFTKEKEKTTWLQTINLKNAQLQTLAKFNGLQQLLRPTLSPDGQTIALSYDVKHPMFNAMVSIGVLSLNDVTDTEFAPIKQLTKEMKMYNPKWLNDNIHIVSERIYGAYPQLYLLNKNTGSTSQITHSPAFIWNYAISHNGLQIAWVAQDAHDNFSVHIADTNGKNAKQVLTLPSAAGDLELSEVREISWKTKNYPSQIAGLLILPLNYQEGQRYPLVVYIHGGGVGSEIHPIGDILHNSPLEWQLWAAKGYAVFVADYRSSGGYGSLAFDRILENSKDELTGDIADIESGVDALIERGIVDSQRMAVIGFSAGAHRVNELLATSNRYKAIISKEGWADDVVASHATTPTLFVMGNPKLGGVDRNDTVKHLYSSLQARGIETEYIQYLDEGHALLVKANRSDALARIIKWIDEHTA